MTFFDFPENQFSKTALLMIFRRTLFQKKHNIFRFYVKRHVKNKLRYDPRDPSKKIRSEILVKFRVRDASRSFMATHLVAKRCFLGSLGVPGLARTPLVGSPLFPGLGPRALGPSGPDSPKGE